MSKLVLGNITKSFGAFEAVKDLSLQAISRVAGQHN
jgi:ABC-type uncharacterized transport system ATPase subunit